MPKVLIPAAGLGTRFYPFTKAVPKELIPVFNRPVIDYIIDELKNSGFEHIVSIVSKSKKQFEDYLEAVWLCEGNDNSTLTFVRQPKPKGLGHAIWSARNCYKNEFVPIALPDNILYGSEKLLLEMYKVAQENNASVIAVQEVDLEHVSSYGIISVEDINFEKFTLITDIIEKPQIEVSPSRLAVVGRYVLDSEIFKILSGLSAGVGGEIQLTDAILALIKNGKKVMAYRAESQFLDTGTPEGWMIANRVVAETKI
jgi:UTP--glucose-1-phosphate uridylyltransferase